MSISTSIKKGLFVSASVLSAAAMTIAMPLSANAQEPGERIIRDDAAVESSQEIREGDTAITGEEDTMQMTGEDMDTMDTADMSDDNDIQTSEMEMEDSMGTTYSTPATTSPTFSNTPDDDDASTSTYSSTSPRALW